MNSHRLLPVVLLALATTGAMAQESVQTFKVVDVRWVDQVDSRGNHTTDFQFFHHSASDPDQAIPQGMISLVEQSRVLARDDQWRQAKLANDLSLIVTAAKHDLAVVSADRWVHWWRPVKRFLPQATVILFSWQSRRHRLDAGR